MHGERRRVNVAPLNCRDRRVRLIQKTSLINETSQLVRPFFFCYFKSKARATDECPHRGQTFSGALKKKKPMRRRGKERRGKNYVSKTCYSKRSSLLRNIRRVESPRA